MKWIEVLDQMSSEPRMYLHGKVRYHTAIGGLITILAYSAVLILAIFFLLNFFDKPDPNILSYMRYEKFDAKANLTDRPFFWYMSHKSGKLVDERIYKVSLVFMKIQQAKGMKFLPVPTQPCNSTNWYKSRKYDEMLKAYDMKKMTCVQDGFEDLILTASTYTGEFNTLQMYISRCTNSTYNNNMCLPQQTIDSFFDNPANAMMLNYATPSTAIDHSNSSPIQENMYYNVIEINPSLYVSEAQIYKTTMYDSDDGLIFQEINSYTSTSVDDLLSRSQRSIGLKPINAVLPGSIFQLSIYSSYDNYEYYKRTYPKLQTVIASISAVARVITLIGGIIVKFVTFNMMTVDLSNYIHYFPETNSKYKMKNITANKNTKEVTNQNNIIPCKTAEEAELENIDKKNVPRVLRKKESKPAKKSLSTLEAILPAFCLPKTSLKNKLNDFKAITMDKLSTNHLLEISSELEILKFFILTKDQKVLFDNIKNSPSEKQLKYLRNSSTFEETESINNKNDEKLNKFKNDNSRQTTRTNGKLI